MEAQILRKRVRALLWFFVVSLVFWGSTAFPLQWEINILQRIIGVGAPLGSFWPAMAKLPSPFAAPSRTLLETSGASSLA